MMKKKIIASIIVLSLIITIMPLSVFASESKIENLEFESQICMVQGNSEEIFNKKSSDVMIKYNYHINADNAKDKYRASLSFAIPTQEGIKNINVEGELEKTIDENNNWFLIGPLEGSFSVGATTYDVTAGFTNELETGKVNAGVSITSSSMNNEIEDAIMFAFGDKINRKETPESPVKGTYEVEPFSFSNVASATVKLKELTSVTAMSMTGKYERSTKRVKNQIKSKISTVKTHYKDKGINASVKISYLKIGLKRVSTTNKTYIIGVERLPIGNTPTGTVLLKSVFLDMLSLAGLPTSTIDAMLGDSKGSAFKDVNSDDTYVEINFASNAKANFDSTAFPVVFQMARSAESATTEKYKFYANITYQVHHSITLGGTTTFYLHSNTASDTASITI